MVSELEFRYGNRASFPGRWGFEVLFNLFQNSNEEIMDRKQKEWSMVKWGEAPLQWEGHVKTRQTLYVWSMCMMVLPRLLCLIHVGEHSVHARLNYWIWSQKCKNTLLWHECSTSECTKWDDAMAGGDELSENSNQLLQSCS